MLSINSLHDELLERQNKKNRIYEDVLEKVITKIKYVNSKSSDCFLVYTLKNFIFGIPLYNIQECGNYLQKRLSDAGFHCKYNQKNNIFISWKSRPAKEKFLISHQYTQPRTASIEYPENNKYGLKELTNEPNMLRYKINPNSQNGIVTKQQQFSELDKQFLNMDLDTSKPFSNNIPNIPHRPVIQPNYHQGNQLFKNNNNIKSISYNTNKYIIKNNKGVSSTKTNNLDEFLGTLM
jgi:hypothetical protein